MTESELNIQGAVRLAREITRKANAEIYYLGKLFYDRGLADYFFLGYAYFRWADDWVDSPTISAEECQSFLCRQRNLLQRFYQGETPPGLCPEERIPAQLVTYDLAHGSEMRPAVFLMLECLEFDGIRRDQIVSQEQLSWYSEALGRSYTDSQQYFIGHGRAYPQGPDQYVAGTVAHHVHILRDFSLDLSEGYMNISREDIDAYHIDLAHINDVNFQRWVYDKVHAAREGFRVGKAYLDRLDVLRCKLVGYLYCLRYEAVLDVIEKRDNYYLRESYAMGKWGKLRFLGRALWICLRVTAQHLVQSLQSLAQPGRGVRNSRRETS